MLAENERQFTQSRQRHYIRDACTELRTGGRAAFGYTKAMLAKTDGHRGKSVLGVQNQCLLRVIDARASGFVMTKPVLAKSERQLCKQQLFVRKPTRHRTSEPQGETHFSPSRAVVSCDFQGAICKKEARSDTRF